MIVVDRLLIRAPKLHPHDRPPVVGVLRVWRQGGRFACRWEGTRAEHTLTREQLEQVYEHAETPEHGPSFFEEVGS